MNNKDICRFVNSKDIKQYLLEINYDFSTAEAAWLVYQCRTATLDEKIMAWKDIVNTMPDHSIDSPHFDEPYESIHRVILDFISLKEEAKKLFSTESEKAFYQYTLVYSDGSMDYDDSIFYSSYEKCMRQMNNEIKEENDDAVSGLIRRSEIDGLFTITVAYNNNSEIMDVRIPRDYGILDWNLLDFFDDLWFHFPVPYKKGDILYDPRRFSYGARDGLIVMTGITPLQYEEDGRTHTDSSDMNVWGYFQEETGILYQEVTYNYMDYELFPEEKLIGRKRILKALSNLLKEEISLDLFVRAYHLIILEETRNDLMPRGWYTDEGLQLAGIWDGKESFSEKMFANEFTES